MITFHLSKVDSLDEQMVEIRDDGVLIAGIYADTDEYDFAIFGKVGAKMSFHHDDSKNYGRLYVEIDV